MCTVYMIGLRPLTVVEFALCSKISYEILWIKWQTSKFNYVWVDKATSFGHYNLGWGNLFLDMIAILCHTISNNSCAECLTVHQPEVNAYTYGWIRFQSFLVYTICFFLNWLVNRMHIKYFKEHKLSKLNLFHHPSSNIKYYMLA